MAKRKLGVPVVLVVLAAIAWYMNRETLARAPVSQDGSNTVAAGDMNLPCHTYKEHRKDVDAAIAVPVLKDAKAPAYKVLEVIDGDTIVINKDGETRVRFMAMDTPEKSETRYGHAEYFGEQSWQHAKSLIAASGNQVQITYDKTKQDQYGRDLAYVWLKDGRLLNGVMVADGYAYSYTSSPKPQYVDTFLALMRQARAERKGLWNHCN